MLTVAMDDAGVALVTIDDPDRPMNVTGPRFYAAVDDLLTRIADDPAIAGVVLTSGKANGFIAGGDIKDFVTAYDRGMTPDQGAALADDWNRLFRRLERCGKPVAAALNGLALGGGLEVALCCTARILVDDAKAVLGLPECGIGLLPGGGGTQRLPRLIGLDRAIPLILEGTRLKPAEALACGLVDAVVPPGEVIAAARAWVLANPAGGPAACRPWDRPDFAVPGGIEPSGGWQAQFDAVQARGRGNYPAPAAALRAVRDGIRLPLDEGLRVEAREFGALLAGPVARNLMRTMFVNKGEADKLARRPAEVARTKVGRLGVIGAGMMGAGIAHVAAGAGIEVVLLDATLQQAEKGCGLSAQWLSRDVGRKRLSDEAAAARLERIRPAEDFAELSGCDLVIEAVFEDRAVKADVIARAEAEIADTAVLASNTSTLPIASLAATASRPDRFVGIHFFSPVPAMALVEVIVGPRTAVTTVAAAMDFVGQLRKTPIVVNDSPGFYANRLFIAFVDEAMAMLAEGVAPDRIEEVARDIGMPVGPLAITDEVSIELQWKVARQAEADGLEPRFRRLLALPVIRRMTQVLGRLGRKSGAGFYEYLPDGGKRLWPGLAAEFPVGAAQPGMEVLRDRFLYVQALEGARCLEEGVVTHPADADLGAVLGVGFPTWTGGPLSFVETVGLPAFVARCRELVNDHGSRFEPSAWLVAKAAAKSRFYEPAA